MSAHDCNVLISLGEMYSTVQLYYLSRSSETFTSQARATPQYSAPAQINLCSHRKETISSESLKSTGGIQMTL